MTTPTNKLSASQHIVLELGASAPCSASYLVHTLHMQHDANTDAYEVSRCLNLLMREGYVELYDDATTWQLTEQGVAYLRTF